MKKVLIFIPEFPSLSETFIAREVNRLVEWGNLDITVVSKNKGQGTVSEKSKEITHYESITLFTGLASLRFLVTRPHLVFSALATVGIANFYVFLQGLSYAHIFSKYSPDIIYAHFLSKHSSIAMVASMILDTEFAISAHARDILEYPHLPAEKADYAKFISICNKNACQKAIEISKIKDPENIKLVYHGIHSSDLEIKEQAPVINVPLIFCVARYVKKKGLDYLIEASLLLKGKGIEHKLVIVGGGDLHPELKELVKEYKLENYVELPGSMSFEKIKSYYSIASVYVQPSINAESGDQDGIPTTLIEAAMYKIPVITTNAGSIEDLYTYENAIIVPQKNSEKLAHGIETLLANKELAKSNAEKAYEKAKGMFDSETNVKQIEEMLLV